jgi:uncharacterized damage-inducible protein DinB
VTLDEARELFDYDRWANQRLWDAVTALPVGAVDQEIGTQFSFSTLKGMLAHILSAHFVWLSRWRGMSPSALPSGKDFPDLASLRDRWDRVGADLTAFIAGLSEPDLATVIHYRNTQGQAFALPLAQLIRHLINHGTHHRSELATMLTMLGVSLPPTDLVVFQLIASGQMAR